MAQQRVSHQHKFIERQMEALRLLAQGKYVSALLQESEPALKYACHSLARNLLYNPGARLLVKDLTPACRRLIVELARPRYKENWSAISGSRGNIRSFAAFVRYG